MILGRDLLDDLGIDLRFSDNVIEWDGQECDFRPEGHHDDLYSAARWLIIKDDLLCQTTSYY